MIDSVFEKGLSVIKKIQETQKEALDNRSAEMIAECFVSNHHFYVSGSGHSHTVAEEFYEEPEVWLLSFQFLQQSLH